MVTFLRKVTKVSLACVLMLSGLTLTTQAEEPIEPGVTVVADEASNTGYTAHFSYDVDADRERAGIEADQTILNVELVGSFRVHSSYTLTDDPGHSLYEYQNGDFVANVHPSTWSGEWAFDMILNDETGCYEISVPMVSGAHYYYYRISLGDADGNVIYVTNSRGQEVPLTVSIDDPQNPSPCRINEANSNSDTGDITHSIVYGKRDAVKQSDSPNLDYMTPYTGADKGQVVYDEYQETLADDLDIGIYLPAGYDPDREEPYRVIYLSHGAGGNETYWFCQPQATNIMDHLIAENPDQEAIIVGLDNTLYRWDYPAIADNVINYVIPYMEEHYNVSTDPDDRAFAGFSMGSMVTTYMAFHHADEFGYFGIFSGTNMENVVYEAGFEYDEDRFDSDEAYRQEANDAAVFSEDLLNSVVFTQAGNYDTAVLANGWHPSMAYEMIRDVCQQHMEANFIDGGFVYGSHDIYTWAQCLYNFANDICWSEIEEVKVPVKDDDKPVVPTEPTTPEIKDPTNTQTGDDINLVPFMLMSSAALLGIATALYQKKKQTLE